MLWGCSLAFEPKELSELNLDSLVWDDQEHQVRNSLSVTCLQGRNESTWSSDARLAIHDFRRCNYVERDSTLLKRNPSFQLWFIIWWRAAPTLMPEASPNTAWGASCWGNGESVESVAWWFQTLGWLLETTKPPAILWSYDQRGRH